VYGIITAGEDENIDNRIKDW